MRDIGGADKGQICGRFSCIVAVGERVEWVLVVGAIAWLHFQQQKRVSDNDADHLSVMYAFSRIYFPNDLTVKNTRRSSGNACHTEGPQVYCILIR